MSYGMHLYCEHHNEDVWLTVHGGAGDRLAPSNECAIACFVSAHGHGEECHVVLLHEDDERLDDSNGWGRELPLMDACAKYGVRPSSGAVQRDVR